MTRTGAFRYWRMKKEKKEKKAMELWRNYRKCHCSWCRCSWCRSNWNHRNVKADLDYKHQLKELDRQPEYDREDWLEMYYDYMDGCTYEDDIEWQIMPEKANTGKY